MTYQLRLDTDSRAALRLVYATSGILMTNPSYQEQFGTSTYTTDLHSEFETLLYAKRVDPERLRAILTPLKEIYTALARVTGLQAQGAHDLARDFDHISGGHKKFGAAEDLANQENNKAKALAIMNKSVREILATIEWGLKQTDPEQKVVSIEAFRRKPRGA